MRVFGARTAASRTDISDPPERALSAQERDCLEQVRLPLSVLSGDQSDAGAEENGVRREVAKGPGGDFEEAQGFLFQRRMGITT